MQREWSMISSKRMCRVAANDHGGAVPSHGILRLPVTVEKETAT